MSNFSVNEIIEMAVQIEQSGYAFYNQSLKNENISQAAIDLLTLLRDQEVKHEKFFLNLRNQEDLFDLEMAQDWELISSYIKMITDSRLFSDENSAIKLATTSQSEKEIVNHAISFEKDTLLFFHTIKDHIKQNKAKDIVQEIIQEEITHVFRLTEYKEKHIK